MTDRYAGFLVTLNDAIREDDAQPVIDAIRLIRGVIAVEPVHDDIDIQIAETRARTHMHLKIVQFLQELGK